MGDAIYLANLPTGLDLYAGYDDGNWPDAASIAAAFPGKTVMRITVFPNDNLGDCLDVENGDATPASAPGWTIRRRLAGHGGPLNYCSWSALPALRAQYSAQKVPEPAYWIAGYPAPDGDAIPTVPGCTIVGHQWIDHGNWDESVMVDYLPGIDPAPVPPAPKKENYVLIINDGTTQYLLGESLTKLPIPDGPDLDALATQLPSLGTALTPGFVASIPNV